MEIIFLRIIFFCNALLSSEWDDSDADSFFDSRLWLCQYQPLHAAAATEVIHCFWFFDLANSPRSKCILTSENWMLRGFRDPSVEPFCSVERKTTCSTLGVNVQEFSVSNGSHPFVGNWKHTYIYYCIYILRIYVYIYIIHTHLVHVCPFKSHFICGISWHYSWPCDDLFCLLRSYPDVARFCFGSTGFSVVALIMTSQSLDALGSWDLGCFPVDANVTNGGYRIMGQILSFNSDV